MKVYEVVPTNKAILVFDMEDLRMLFNLPVVLDQVTKIKDQGRIPWRIVIPSMSAIAGVPVVDMLPAIPDTVLRELAIAVRRGE